MNESQGIGALKLDVQREPIDALVSCGYKRLCGPYGAGFCWITPELRNQLDPAQTYWPPHVWGQENLRDYAIKKELGAAAFDIFCTANFLNFMPWQASIEYIDIALRNGDLRFSPHIYNTLDETERAVAVLNSIA